MIGRRLTPRVIAIFAFAIAFACSSPPEDARVIERTPDTASFPAVAAMLVQACGSLDCHGTVGRNLRLYGDTALRYSPTDVPSHAFARLDARNDPCAQS